MPVSANVNQTKKPLVYSYFSRSSLARLQKLQTKAHQPEWIYRASSSRHDPSLTLEMILGFTGLSPFNLNHCHVSAVLNVKYRHFYL